MCVGKATDLKVDQILLLLLPLCTVCSLVSCPLESEDITSGRKGTDHYPWAELQ